MVYIFLIALTIFISTAVVRVGAIALRLTGIKWDIALFQAISAFTRTGYTTKESEMVTHDPARRNIIIWLILLGNAGIASFIITALKVMGMHFDVDPVRKIIFASLTALLIILLYVFSFSKKLQGWVDNVFENQIRHFTVFNRVNYHDIYSVKTGYGMLIAQISPGSILCGKKQAELDFQPKEIVILAIERNHSLIPVPGVEEVIMENDKLLCYGNLEKIVTEILYKNPGHEKLLRKYKIFLKHEV